MCLCLFLFNGNESGISTQACNVRVFLFNESMSGKRGTYSAHLRTNIRSRGLWYNIYLECSTHKVHVQVYGRAHSLEILRSSRTNATGVEHLYQMCTHICTCTHIKYILWLVCIAQTLTELSEARPKILQNPRQKGRDSSNTTLYGLCILNMAFYIQFDFIRLSSFFLTFLCVIHLLSSLHVVQCAMYWML